MSKESLYALLAALVIYVCFQIARRLMRRRQVRWSIAFGLLGSVATIYLLYQISQLMRAGLG